MSAHHMMHHAKSCSSLFVYEFHLGIVSDVQEQHQTMEERFQVCSARTYKRNTTCSDIKNRVWATFFFGYVLIFGMLRVLMKVDAQEVREKVGNLSDSLRKEVAHLQVKVK